MLLPTDLLGEWELRRTVDDRLAGTAGTVVGTTTLRNVGPGEVRWVESGTMHFSGRRTEVSRTLSVRRGADGGWTVHFADGRVFHEWAWGARVDHPCAPDHYAGVLAGDTERWTVRWEALGPAKDYVLVSELRRRPSTAD